MDGSHEPQTFESGRVEEIVVWLYTESSRNFFTQSPLLNFDLGLRAMLPVKNSGMFCGLPWVVFYAVVSGALDDYLSGSYTQPVIMAAASAQQKQLCNKLRIKTKRGACVPQHLGLPR